MQALGKLLKQGQIKVDGKDMSMEDAIQVTDQSKIGDIDTALSEYNKTNGTQFTRENLLEKQKASKVWNKKLEELEKSGLKIQKGYAGKEVKFHTTKQYSKELKSQEALNNAGKEMRKELKGIVTKYTEKYSGSVGKATRNIKETVVKPFMTGWNSVAIA